MLIFCTFYSSKNPEKNDHGFHKNIKKLFLTLIKNNNKSCFNVHYISLTLHYPESSLCVCVCLGPQIQTEAGENRRAAE